MQVLIVDDNPINLKLASDVLKSSGVEVHQSASAEEAEAALATLSPDLILMDISLPGTDGLTLTRKLKANVRLGKIPVVALTASAMKGDDLKAIAAGCDGYIAKPIDTRKFFEQVSAYVRHGLS
jgi:CheY-like chemotaxis protein